MISAPPVVLGCSGPIPAPASCRSSIRSRSLGLRIFQHHARIERGAIGFQRDIVSGFDARRAPELPRCRGICEIIPERHRHRDFVGALLHDVEIPRLQPRLAMLGIRERRKDAAIHHQPVVIENAGLHSVGHADLGAIKLFVAGRLVDDGKNAPAKFGHQRYLQIAILEQWVLNVRSTMVFLSSDPLTNPFSVSVAYLTVLQVIVD